MKNLSRWLKKYFIPHKHNEFKPHFLRYESSIFVLLIILVVELVFLAQVFIVFDKTNFLASVLPAVLTNLTNQERAQNGADPLVENVLLTKAAQLKAQDMATNGYFAHTSPDGKTPWYWFDKVGYKYTMAGENLAVNFFESRDVAEAWMNSPTHRANIVKKNYKEIGIGIASGVYEGQNTVFVAQLFGTPMPTFTPPAPQTTTTTPEKTKVVTKTTTTKTPTVVKTVTQPKPTTAPTTVSTAPREVQVLGEETNTVDTKTIQNENWISKIELFVQKLIASPRTSVTYIYAIIASIIVLTILLAVFVKSEIRHPAIIVRGVSLVAVILFLLFVNIKILHLDTEIPSESIEASVIAY